MSPLARLRCAGWVEGVTLILMLCVAVPLKYVFDAPAFVSVMGPVHGGCFSLYLVLACATMFDGTWPPRQIMRVLLAALVPFGTFLNDGLLAARMRGAAGV